MLFTRVTCDFIAFIVYILYSSITTHTHTHTQHTLFIHNNSNTLYLSIITHTHTVYLSMITHTHSIFIHNSSHTLTTLYFRKQALGLQLVTVLSDMLYAMSQPVTLCKTLWSSLASTLVWNFLEYSQP